MRSKTLVLFFFVVAVNCQSLGKITDLNYDLEDARNKKKGASKYVLPLLIGALLVKAIVFPLAFKAMAVMSSISVLLSTMSLILSSIVGYVKLGTKQDTPSIKVIHGHPYSSWSKEDRNAHKDVYEPRESYDLVAPPPQQMM